MSTARGLTNTTWDVIVVGAGPAGAAIAITLAKYDRRVLLVERRVSANFKLGESLPPVSIGLVEHFLGDLEGPGQDFTSFFRTIGNLSQWETDKADISDFFFTQTGFGLCVDRLDFDDAMRSKAVAAGATLLKGARFESCSRIADRSFNWRLTLTSNTQTQHHHSRYLVDCSGRRAVLAKTLGVETVQDDQLFAYAQWFSCAGDDDDRYTRIEAAPYGWWYSNRLPSTENYEPQRLVVLHTDSDLPAARMAASRDGFDQLLDLSTHIAPLLKAKDYRPRGTIRGAPAGSQRLLDFCGDAWMAVGDAAQAYDPLSSQGIDKALRTASCAGHMIHYALTDCLQGVVGLDRQNSYVQRYDKQQRQLWQNYLSQRNLYYGAQPRWPDQLFWRRRQSPATADILNDEISLTGYSSDVNKCND
nr:FAD-dependent oxidoreductase [Acidocella aromatica]